MGRIILFVAISLVVFSFVSQRAATAQTVGEGVNMLQNPAAPPPLPLPVFPVYPIIPLEDLNNFEKSTLEPTTLGETTTRTSNLEINRVIDRGERRENVQAVIQEPTADETFTDETFSPLPPSTSEKFYTWVDKNGVIHATNDPDSIPSRYREKVKVRGGSQ